MALGHYQFARSLEWRLGGQVSPIDPSPGFRMALRLRRPHAQPAHRRPVRDAVPPGRSCRNTQAAWKVKAELHTVPRKTRRQHRTYPRNWSGQPPDRRRTGSTAHSEGGGRRSSCCSLPAPLRERSMQKHSKNEHQAHCPRVRERRQTANQLLT